MDYQFNLWNLVWLPIGYLFGCFSTSYVLGRFLGVDITKKGASRTATVSNLGRLRGIWALPAVIGEVGKAWLTVTIALYITDNNPWAAVFSSMGAIIGHSLPWWLDYKGGKAMSPGFGALLAISTVEKNVLAIVVPAFLVALTTWWVTWRVSVGSISASTTIIASTLLLPVLFPNTTIAIPYTGLIVVGAFFALLRLRNNLWRLLNKKEHMTPFLWWKRFPHPPWIQPRYT